MGRDFADRMMGKGASNKTTGPNFCTMTFLTLAHELVARNLAFILS